MFLAQRRHQSCDAGHLPTGDDIYVRVERLDLTTLGPLEKVVLLPDDAMRFVSVGIDQSIAIYDAEAYRQLDFKALQDAGSDAKVHFELRAQEKKLINADNLRTLLNM